MPVSVTSLSNVAVVERGDMLHVENHTHLWVLNEKAVNMQSKTTLRLIGTALVIGALSACAAQGPYGGGTTLSPDAKRALIGAGAGAVTAKAFDEDIGAGAALGAAAGALCDDARVCQ